MLAAYGALCGGIIAELLAWPGVGHPFALILLLLLPALLYQLGFVFHVWRRHTLPARCWRLRADIDGSTMYFDSTIGRWQLFPNDNAERLEQYEERLNAGQTGLCLPEASG